MEQPSNEILLWRIGEVERLLREHTAQDNTNFERIEELCTQIRLDIATLKVKSGLWGASAGGLLIGAALAAKYGLGL